MRPKHAIDYQNLPRPLAVMRREYKSGMNFGWHSHRRGQLLYGSTGYMTALTEEGAFMLPRLRGVTGARSAARGGNVRRNGNVLALC